MEQESKKKPRKLISKRFGLSIGVIGALLITIGCIYQMLNNAKALSLKQYEQTATTIYAETPVDLLKEVFQKEVQSINETLLSENDSPKREEEENNFKEDVQEKKEKEEEQQSIRLSNLTVFGDEEIITQCYEPGAFSYQWEVYSDLDQQWMAADKKAGIEMAAVQNQAGAEVSTLKVTEKEKLADSMKIRCTVRFSEAEDKEEVVSEGTISRYQDKGKIVGISIPEFKTDIGKELSSLELPVLLQNENGKKKEVSGIQSLVFCLEQEEESSRVFDEESSLTTDIYKKSYHEARTYLVKSGKQNVQLRCRILDEEYDFEALIIGADESAPEIGTIKADYKVSNIDTEVPASIMANVTDNVDLVTDLQFAFAYETVPVEKLNWTEEMPIQQDLSKNGLYFFYAKDTAGNISKQEIEIIAVDMKNPVIEKVDLKKVNQSYTVTVMAKDKTKLEYCLDSEQSNQEQHWQESETFQIAENGIYVLRLRDAAGNETVYPDQIKITDLDDAPPIIIGIEEIEAVEKESTE